MQKEVAQEESKGGKNSEDRISNGIQKVKLETTNKEQTFLGQCCFQTAAFQNTTLFTHWTLPKLSEQVTPVIFPIYISLY